MSVSSRICTTTLLIVLAAVAGPLWGVSTSSSAPVIASPAAPPAAPAAASLAPESVGSSVALRPVTTPAPAVPPTAMSVAGEPGSPDDVPNTQPSVSTVIIDENQDSLSQIVNGVVFTTNRGNRAGEPVLVVPGREVEPQSFDPLVEDLSIMSRIIQKSLSDGYPLLADMSAMNSLLINLTGQSPGSGPRLFFPVTRRPKPMYIGGYGALFFLQVDFPLLPPREQLEQAAAERADPVWAETRRSLFEPQTVILPDDAPPAEPYDEGKVQMLKDKLKTVMRHAANIRALEPNEWLVIVVQGTAPEAGAQAPAAANAPPGVSTTCGRTLLTLRARKADIDQYARDQLDPAQFEQRLQLVMSR